MRNARSRDKFQPDLKIGDGYTLLSLRGVLDEDNTLARLTNKVRGTVMILDLEGVERINSCGVRDWVNWLQQITALDVQVVMTRCSPSIINQVNMVTNFAAGAVIHSFFAPYFDPDTEEEKNVLVKTADLVGQYPPRAPEVRSERGTLMEFDDFEESYFAFVTSLDPGSVALDGDTLGLIDGMSPAPRRPNTPSSSTITYSGEIESVRQPAPPALETAVRAPDSPSPVGTWDRTPPPDPMDEPTPLATPVPHSGPSQSWDQRPFSSEPTPVRAPFDTHGGGDQQRGFISSPQDAQRAVGQPRAEQWASQAGNDRSVAAIVVILALALIGVLGVLLWLVLG